MEFTEEQQAQIDKIINKRIGEVKAKAEQEKAAAIAEAIAGSGADALRADVETLKSERVKDGERLRLALLKSEVAQTDAVDVTTVMKLVSDGFVMGEDGALQAVDSEGTPLLDDGGSPLSAQGFLQDYLLSNPYLQKAAPSSGSGSQGLAGAAGLMGQTKTMRRGDFDILSAQRKRDFVASGGKVS